MVAQSPTANPATVQGQLVMLAGFAVGLAVVSTLAGSVGAFLLSASHEQSDRDRRDRPGRAA